MCVLSDGAEGIVDISPLFKDGFLTVNDTKKRYKYDYDPCRGVECNEQCESGSCAVCQKGTGSSSYPQFGAGSLNTAAYTITDFVSPSAPFSMTVQYSKGNSNRKSVVKLIYNETAVTPQFVFEDESPQNTYLFHVVTNGPGVKVINNTRPKGHTSGPYPIQRDACTGWSEQDSLLYKAGLLKLSAQATVLNYTWTRAGYTFDYFVGVCVAPIPSGLKHCHIVQRITEPNGDISFHCLGGDVDNQVTDTKDLGWMILSYTYGNQYAFQCDSSIRRSKIHFFCSRGAGVGTPIYLEQNPLQEKCFYMFNWPTEILCGPMNTTQSSLTGNQSPLSLDSSILIGIAGGTLALVIIFFITSTISICYLCGKRRRTHMGYHRMIESERQEKE
jgi:hypothetical protein